MSFNEKWLEAVRIKNSLLCVNIDPAEWGQRENGTIGQNIDKVAWTIELIESVAPYAAAIKPNRQYFKDVSRQDMKKINDVIHKHQMLSIDDSKIADIGDTNDAALYHAVEEGFDAVTYAPFPGNIEATCKMAQKRGIGLIPLVLMSNPEYKLMKQAQINGIPAYKYIAQEVKQHGADGIVIGAPSEKNHITLDEIACVREIVGHKTVLVPGIGAQGGDLKPIIDAFGDYTITSVGRAIAYADKPQEKAQEYHELIQAARS